MSKSPSIEYDEFINDRTGKKYKVPKGVDPAFAFNVGKTREQGIDKAFSDKFGKLPENIAKVVIKDIIASNRFKMLKDGKMSGWVPVGVLPYNIAKLLIDDTQDRTKEIVPESFSTIFFSNYTAKKQREKHSDITIKDYEYVQWLLENGEYRKDKNKHLVFVGNNGRNIKAVIKRSERGEYFLQTIHEIKDKQVKRVLKRKK